MGNYANRLRCCLNLTITLLVGKSSLEIHGFQSPLAFKKRHAIQEKPSTLVAVPTFFSDNQVPGFDNQIQRFHRRRESSGSSTSLLLTTISPEIWTSFLPPFLGLIKSEYTVAYAYGFSTSLTGLVVFLRTLASINISAASTLSLTSPSAIVLFHSLALIFYGARLNLFLAIRIQLSSRIRQFNANVEVRAKARGNRFKTRTPFILSCGLLYYGLSVPLLFTSKLLLAERAPAIVPSWVAVLLHGLVATQWLGFLVAALGDFTKTWVKQTQKNESFLVTSGIFSVLRHPNYTGEIVGWTANALCGLVAVAACLTQHDGGLLFMNFRNVANFVAMGLSWVGIVFVLLRATSNLENRQKQDYGSDPKYQQWVGSTWSGFSLKPKENDKKDEDNDDDDDSSQE
ncbi:hypothetical protein ACA910_006946 [Epithemia clementina (nom. ined.)]